MATDDKTEQESTNSKDDKQQTKSQDDARNAAANSSKVQSVESEEPVNKMTFKDDLGPNPFNAAKEENESVPSAESSRYFWIQKPIAEVIDQEVISDTVGSETAAGIKDSKTPADSQNPSQALGEDEPSADI
jgi:hypothetical protein